MAAGYKGHRADLRKEIKNAERFDRSNEEFALARKGSNAARLAHKTMSTGLISKQFVQRRYPKAECAKHKAQPASKKRAWCIYIDTTPGSPILGMGKSKSAAWIDADRELQHEARKQEQAATKKAKMGPYWSPR